MEISKGVFFCKGGKMQSILIGNPYENIIWIQHIPKCRKFRVVQLNYSIFIFLANTSEILNTYTDGKEYSSQLKFQKVLQAKSDWFYVVIDDKILTFFTKKKMKYCTHRKYKGKYGDIIWINFEHSKMTKEAISQQIYYLCNGL